jgi:RimJ/RimL family protein N-acetyltransferase
MEEVELADDRLYVRPWRLGDAAAVFEACQDPEIQRWTSVPSPYQREHAESYVGEISPTAWRSGTGAIFGVFDLVSGRLLAASGVHHISERDVPAGGRGELGYWCAAWARGKGVMTDASRLVCEWAFADPAAGGLGLARIDWYAEVGNLASRRVAEKLGFTLEGTLRQRIVHRSQRADAWAAGLLRGELR